VPIIQLSEVVVGCLGGPGDTHPARLETDVREGTTVVPFIKFLIVTLIAAILGFGITHQAKKAPGL
jgi:hypothetical protein